MKSSKFLYCALASGLVIGVESIQAQNLLVNGSFESGTFVQNAGFTDRMQLSSGSGTITGWTVGVANGPFGYTWWLRSPSYNAADGSRFIDLDSNGNLPGSYVQQTFATTIGQKYAVSGYYSSEFNGGPAVTSVQINGTQIGSVSTGSGNYSGASFNNLVWTNETFYFTATSNSTTLRLQDDTITTSPVDNAVIDNFSVTAVPETGSTGLYFALALGGLAWFGTSKRAIIKKS